MDRREIGRLCIAAGVGRLEKGLAWSKSLVLTSRTVVDLVVVLAVDAHPTQCAAAV
jgi:hypothetical protein